MGDCAQEAKIYITFAHVSLALTVVNVLIALKYKEKLSENPANGMKYYFVAGAVKSFLGLMLLTVLYPGDCAGASPVYGVVVLGIGLLWLVRGMKYKKLKDATENNHTTLAPTADMEMA